MSLVSDADHSFYAEFSDYHRHQIDNWLRDNVLAHCRWQNAIDYFHHQQDRQTQVYGDRAFIAPHLRAWLDRFDAITIWADCYAWDWVLFAQLFGGAFGLPRHIHYMPGDLSTLFRARGLDPDTDREPFAALEPQGSPRAKHNALWDAQVVNIGRFIDG